MATGWTFTERNPSELKKHPTNEKIYGAQSTDKDMLESVKEFGVLEPIRITLEDVILSGHRRRDYAVIARLKAVPVLVASSRLSEEEQIIEIVESNRQREKTIEQKAREFSFLTEAKAKLAKKRQATSTGGAKPQLGKKIPEAERGRAKDQAAAAVGLSRPTAEKALGVVREIDRLADDSKNEEAAALRDTLNNGSVTAVHRAVSGVPAPARRNLRLTQEGYDDKIIDDLIGKLVRCIDERAKRLGHVGTSQTRALMQSLDGVIRNWKNLQKETRK